MPYTFEAGCAQIIRAIDEAVMKMSLGERAILEISSQYGWGKKGVSKIIRPNADLRADVEILAINGIKAKMRWK